MDGGDLLLGSHRRLDPVADPAFGVVGGPAGPALGQDQDRGATLLVDLDVGQDSVNGVGDARLAVNGRPARGRWP